MYVLHSPRVELQSWIQQQRALALFCWSFRVNETFYLVLFNPSSAVFVPTSTTVETEKKSRLNLFLDTCQKDVSSHQSAWSFSRAESETELIGLCTQEPAFMQCNIRLSVPFRPFHQSELSIGWRRNSSACQVPPDIAHRSTGKGKLKLRWQRSGEGGVLGKTR